MTPATNSSTAASRGSSCSYVALVAEADTGLAGREPLVGPGQFLRVAEVTTLRVRVVEPATRTA